MRNENEQRKRRLRALKSGWRAQHGRRIFWDPEIAPEYRRRFYACLWGSLAPAWGLLEHLDGLGA